MDSDIQFGDVQEAIPEEHLRPDRNAHYAVVPYESPVEGELPVFLDLDVMMDMEAHAQSDKTVELGGVLLGGQYHDADGNAFVVITDSLRAQHYESTKGSFKFTHDTWTQINRQRNEFPPELQMVGWYHTHPDWGVFLSGMDMFICDHFFNRPLDVAYVIDPCRGDRAFFQWTGNERERVKRTRGFYVMASRFREAELAYYVAQLQSGSTPMPSDPRSGGFPGLAPVINVTQPPQSSPNQNLALMAMLTIQACLLMLIAWRMLGPTNGAMADLSTEVAALRRERDSADLQAAQSRVMSRVLSEIKGEDVDIAKAVSAERSTEQLRKFQAAHAELMDEKVLLEKQNATWEKDFEKLTTSKKDQKKDYDEKLAKLTAEIKQLKAESKAGGWGEIYGVSWYWIGGALLVIVLIGCVAVLLTYKPVDDRVEPAINIPDTRRLPLENPAPSPAPPGELPQ